MTVVEPLPTLLTVVVHASLDGVWYLVPKNPYKSIIDELSQRKCLGLTNPDFFLHGLKCLSLIPSCGGRLCCTQQRMQLVVMAAVLALARVGHGCSYDCRPTNISIPVESCGLTELIYTTICAGQCYHVVTDRPHPDVQQLTLMSCKWSITLFHLSSLVWPTGSCLHRLS